MSIQQYLARILKYYESSHECLVISLIHIDRIVTRHPEFPINSLSIHRILATSIMCAAKFFDDIYYSNAYYAKVAGINVREMNNLEAQYLWMLDWRLHVMPEEYNEFLDAVLGAYSGELSWENFTLSRR